MTTANIRWIDSTSWELPFFGLPSHIPWPAEVDSAIANQMPLEVNHLLDAIEALGDEAKDPFKSFLAAADYFSNLTEALHADEIGSAVEALDEIDRIHPDTAFALFHRALIARREGGDLDAIDLFEQAAEKAPQVGPIWDRLGALYTVRGEREKAITAFRKALEIMPNDGMALEGLAALNEMVKLKSADPSQPNAVRFVDRATFRELALQQAGMMQDPQQLFNYADQLLRDGNAIDAAVLALERANQLQPGQPPLMHALAAAYRMNKQLPASHELVTRITELFPNDANGFLHLAQCCDAMGDREAETAALERALEIDPNSQPALAVFFELAPGEHHPDKEAELSEFAEECNSWRAHLLAGGLASERGDHPSTLRHVERAYAMSPENEEVLIAYASAITANKDLTKLAAVIRPAVESGKYSKRLDWHYAHMLRQLNLTRDAVGVLQKAASGDAPDEFKRMVATTLDAWSGFLTGCGVKLETLPNGFLQRAILIALPDGDDGGIVLAPNAQLPAEGKFTWRANGDKTSVSLQQGESETSQPPLKLGAFKIRAAEAEAPATVDCHLVALPDGALHFRAFQNGKKLQVAWVQKA